MGCMGDSGGPMVRSQGSTYQQIGIVSWGIACGKEHFPGVYTRVGKMRQWIDTDDKILNGVFNVYQHMTNSTISDYHLYIMSIFGRVLFNFTKSVNPMEFKRKYFGKTKFLAANCCNITN